MRICQHEALQKYADAGIKFEYTIPNECLGERTAGQRRRGSGSDWLRLLLYADDIVIFARTKEELEGILEIFQRNFVRYGLTMAENKTVSMVFSGPESDMVAPSLVKLAGTPLENVRKFRYLGHLLSNEQEDAYLGAQISSAWAKWRELKTIFRDSDIDIRTRVQILEATVRSRLLYSVQSWTLTARQKDQLNAVWLRFLRHMVRGGFARRDRLNNDYAYRYTNQKILHICKTANIHHFCELQHLEYVGHICRLPNTALQKRAIFMKPTKKYATDYWEKLSKLYDINKLQLRKNYDETMGVSCISGPTEADLPSKGAEAFQEKLMMMMMNRRPQFFPKKKLYFEKS